MGDSDDDDIFWGPVTKYEWQVIRNRFLSDVPSVRESHTDHIPDGLEPNKLTAETCKISKLVIQRSNGHSSIDELEYNQEKNVSREDVEVNDSKTILSLPRGNENLKEDEKVTSVVDACSAEFSSHSCSVEESDATDILCSKFAEISHDISLKSDIYIKDEVNSLDSQIANNDSSCDSGVVLPETVANKVSVECHEISFDTNFKNISVSSINGAEHLSDCVTNNQVYGDEYSDISSCTTYQLEIQENSSHTHSYLLLEECVKESNSLQKDVESKQKLRSVGSKKTEEIYEEKEEQVINLNSVNDSSDCHSAGQFATSNRLSKPLSYIPTTNSTDISLTNNGTKSNQSCEFLDKSISNLSGVNSKENRYSSKEAEFFFLSSKLKKESYEAIEGETDSILCETVIDNSSEESYGLNDTFEEMEMLMKYGLNYVCSGDDVRPSQQTVNKTNFIQNNSQPDDTKCASNRIPFGSKLDSIQNSGEDRVLTHCSKKKHMVQGNTVGDTNNRLTTQMPKSDTFKCPKAAAKKGLNFSKIRSPVAEYIKHRPVQLLKTATKVNSNAKGNCIPPQNLLVKGECSPIQQTVTNVKPLPVINYEKAPVINLMHQGSVERNVPAKALGTPKVIKHTGRAVLATVPPNALQMMKHAEVSVIYDKDVSQTSTL